MVPPVEIGRGGIELLVADGLLKQDQAGDRNALREACLAPLSCGPRAMAHGPWDRVAALRQALA